ncbi:deaminase [Catellatospora sichuanensis]|uniref:deoxycytidylate deaminase n=1 Tax=Catellatospora sichuanensis TaxID=1969805 RepID=UPI0011823366|nr:deaminase [Catellatospora sichuanensis]
MRPGWDEYWLGMAQAASARADCSRRRVGAVVVQGGRLKGGGYNGSPPGSPLSCLAGGCPRATSGVAPGSSYDTGPGECIALHAEMNAVVDAGRDKCLGGTLYVTEEPCGGCRKLLAASGLARVVWPSGALTL